MVRDRLRMTSRNQRTYGNQTAMTNPPAPPMTSSWRVHYLRKALGTVDASDEKSAIGWRVWMDRI